MLRVLENAGFYYDSTMGYNDAVGYESGTVQVFCPPQVEKSYKLPLNIQDSALLYPDRMGLQEDETFKVCQTLIKNNLGYGGVLVINWHHRSIASERLWRDYYLKLLNSINRSRVWWGTSEQTVKWFEKRRKVRFRKVDYNEDVVKIKFEGPIDLFNRN